MNKKQLVSLSGVGLAMFFIGIGVAAYTFEGNPPEVEVESGSVFLLVESDFHHGGDRWCQITLSGSQEGEWFVRACNFPPGTSIELDRVLLLIGQENDPRDDKRIRIEIGFNNSKVKEP